MSRCCGLSALTGQLASLDSITTTWQASDNENDQMMKWNGGELLHKSIAARDFSPGWLESLISILRAEFSQGQVLYYHLKSMFLLLSHWDTVKTLPKGLAKNQVLGLPGFPQCHHSNSNSFNKHMTFWPFHCVSSELSNRTKMTNNSSTQKMDQSFFSFCAA